MDKNKTMITNPILPGFYPDPSICRVGDTYYMVCSSFEMYPGIPIFSSKDLINWEQIGNALTLDNQFHLVANNFGSGVMAPTIRYHRGFFYIINANFSDKGNYIIKSTDPSKTWSDPYWLENVGNIDASLFFDEDQCYIVSPGKDLDGGSSNEVGIFVISFDISEMKTIGSWNKIWNSALRETKSPEAPHLYKKGKYFYLIIAEGGTERYHAVTVARSKKINSWYEANPSNPIMTHRHLGKKYPISNVGHADLFSTPEDEWYAVLLGSRLIEGNHKNLGRETFLCPVTWEDDWPVFSYGTGIIEQSYEINNAKNIRIYKENIEQVVFSENGISMDWVFWGTPYEKFHRISDEGLLLKCLPRKIHRPLKRVDVRNPDYSKDDTISFIAKRQTSINFTAYCKMKFVPKKQEAAGMIVMQACNHSVRIEMKKIGDDIFLSLILTTTNLYNSPRNPQFTSETNEDELYRKTWWHENVVLGINAVGQKYQFYVGENLENMELLPINLDAKIINPEIIGGMMGSLIGLYATANEEISDNCALFSYFRYEQN